MNKGMKAWFTDYTMVPVPDTLMGDPIKALNVWGVPTATLMVKI
jgi:hypothetical protein